MRPYRSHLPPALGVKSRILGRLTVVYQVHLALAPTVTGTAGRRSGCCWRLAEPGDHVVPDRRGGCTEEGVLDPPGLVDQDCDRVRVAGGVGAGCPSRWLGRLSGGFGARAGGQRDRSSAAPAASAELRHHLRREELHRSEYLLVLQAAEVHEGQHVGDVALIPQPANLVGDRLGVSEPDENEVLFY